MWPDLIQKAKDGGLDVIQTYVFWNAHEPEPGKVRTHTLRRRRKTKHMQLTGEIRPDCSAVGPNLGDYTPRVR